MKSIRDYFLNLSRSIPDEIGFYGMEDDDLIISGRSIGSNLQLPEHLLDISLFGALESEYFNIELLIKRCAERNYYDKITDSLFTIPPKPRFNMLKRVDTK